jgi:hypothetical protein
MQRSRIVAAALCSAAWLAACDSPTTQLAPDVSATMSSNARGASGGASGDQASGEGGDDEGGWQNHGYGPRTSPEFRAAAGNAVTLGAISYHGGRVLQSGIKIVSIYWAKSTIYAGGPTQNGGTGSGASDGSLIGHLLRNVGGSPHYNINTSYTDAAGTKLLNSVSYTGFWANNTNVPSTTGRVSNTTIRTMLQSGFTSGKLTYDANTLYTVFSAGRTNLGGGFGTQYCAYHTNMNVTVGGVSRNILVAVMPYGYAYAASCTMFSGAPSPNSDPAADGEISVLVHEIEEAQTDALGNAWYDANGYENADKCAWTFGTTSTAPNGGKYNVTLGGKNFLIQQNWIAPNGGCAMSY